MFPAFELKYKIYFTLMRYALFNHCFHYSLHTVTNYSYQHYDGSPSLEIFIGLLTPYPIPLSIFESGCTDLLLESSSENLFYIYIWGKGSVNIQTKICFTKLDKF